LQSYILRPESSESRDDFAERIIGHFSARELQRPRFGCGECLGGVWQAEARDAKIVCGATVSSSGSSDFGTAVRAAGAEQQRPPSGGAACARLCPLARASSHAPRLSPPNRSTVITGACALALVSGR